MSSTSSTPPLTAPLCNEADERFSAERSVVLRYAASALEGLLSPQDILPCSRQEGMRVLDLGTWKGVNLKLLDESSAMSSGTHKSIDGCVSAAFCRRLGIRRAVFSSGANAGSALSLYAAAIGLESFFFCPAGNLEKLDGALFDRPTAHLVAVEGTDRRVKQAAKRMSELLQAPLIPTLEWRMLAAACRGRFLAEQILRRGLEIHWLVQAVCAGFGPLGIYRTLGALVEAGHLETGRVPRLMAIQQSGLCPIVNAWNEGKAMLPPAAELHADEPLLEPALYNTYPDQTYPDLFRLLTRWKGRALAVTQPEFDEFGREFRARVEDAGIRLTPNTAQDPRLVEQAGLLAGAGALKGISEGRVAKGETVLCALTGGAGPTLAKPALPEARIGLAEDLEQAVCRLANRFAKGN